MEISEQKVTVDLPVLLVDGREKRVQVTEPGLEAAGCWAVPGEADVGLALECALECALDDPSRLRLNVRLLGAHYSTPADCPDHVLEIVRQVNRELTERLVSFQLPHAP